MSDLTEEFRQRILAASSAVPLRLRGSGSKDFYGQLLRGELLDTSAHQGILAYEPSELVMTVRAGTALAEVEAALAEQGQCLAFEPPRFGGRGTIGGAIAAGLSGPRRVSTGAARDFVLGVKILDGAARELSFGGQVMKNVAGYDVSRIMAGSFGTLGLLLELSIKVLPQPVAQSSLRFAMSTGEALDKLNQWAAQPLPIVASAWQEGLLTLRLAGAGAAIVAAEKMLGGEKVGAGPSQADAPPVGGSESGLRAWGANKVGSGETATFWDGLRDQSAPYFAGPYEDKPLWRLSLPSVAPPLDLPGETLIEWGGAQRWLRSAAPASVIRAAAAQVGGNASLFRCADSLKASSGVFTPLPAALLQLQRQLKSTFDPRGIFNPGRLYQEI